MKILPRESTYPPHFRQNEVKELVNHIKCKRSVEIIGMKRVGISNFLRYFIYNPVIFKKYFKSKDKELFIPIDLNDLIERDVYPFWLLTFKRLVDICEKSTINPQLLNKINIMFDKSIQIKDIFFTIDSIRKSLVYLIEQKYQPVFFFIGFDRLKDVFTIDFFDNIRGLRDATHKEIVFIFTSLRELDKIKPDVFDGNSKSTLLSTMYIKPASDHDMKLILKTQEMKYDIKFDDNLSSTIVSLSNGHVQYLYLLIISISEYLNKNKKLPKDILSHLLNDERIQMQSDELISSLTDDEKNVLSKIYKKIPITQDERKHSQYLWNAGIVIENKAGVNIFSNFLEKRTSQNHFDKEKSGKIYLTNKESKLFELLKTYLGTICDRDIIIENVWPEYSEIGISDWAVDKLVARLRRKLEQNNDKYSIKTIRTRGFMMEQI